MQIQNINISHEELLEFIFFIWLLVISNNEFAILEVIMNLCHHSLASSDLGKKTKSVLLGLDVSKRLGLLQQEIAHVALSCARKDVVEHVEWAGIIVEVQNFVAKEVLMHIESFLKVLGNINGRELLSELYLVVVFFVLVIQEVFQAAYSTFLVSSHVIFNLAGHLLAPECAYDSTDFSSVEDTLHLCPELIKWEVIEMLLQNKLIYHRC